MFTSCKPEGMAGVAIKGAVSVRLAALGHQGFHRNDFGSRRPCLGLSHLITVRDQPVTYLIPPLWLPVASPTPGASKKLIVMETEDQTPMVEAKESRGWKGTPEWELPFPSQEVTTPGNIRRGRAWQATPRLLKTITLENIHGQILCTALMETLFKNIMNTQK